MLFNPFLIYHGTKFVIQDTANTHSRVGIRIVGKYKAKLESEAAGLHALNSCQNGRVRATTLLGLSGCGCISLAVHWVLS